MKAISDVEGTLTWVTQPDPVCGPGEVRIAIAATAVNRADLVQRKGHYNPPPGASTILGLECAGVIESVGAGVTQLAVGDPVVALLAGGGYAELVVCPATHVLPLPQGLSPVEGAAVMEVFATAWLNLKVEGALSEGERVLVHAGASGVGTAAIQLCRMWGNPVFATVGSEAKQRRCEGFGADQTANRHEDLWGTQVKEWGGADVVLCPVGGAYLERNIGAMNRRARLVSIGLMGGREGQLPMAPVLLKRLSIRGSVLRSRSVEEKDAVVAGVGREVWPALERKELVPVIDAVLPIEEAEAAHQKVASNATVGKVVLRVR